jgi:hypothetical protein
LRRADDSETRHGGDDEQASRREGGEKGEKQAGDAPYPKAELQRRLTTIDERRGDDGGAD